MTSLWPRLEPLLARVQRPARYIADTLTVARERKGRRVADEIMALRSLTVLEEANGNAVLCAELLTQPRGACPSELVRALGRELELGRGRRTHQWIERDGTRREPLPLGAPTAPHAYERV